jgi:SAM-dependent methyltransferase
VDTQEPKEKVVDREVHISVIYDVIMRGDTEQQAILRDTMIKKGENIYDSVYVQKILSILHENMNLLDIGCGTGHIIQELACTRAALTGVDISAPMIAVAQRNTRIADTVFLVVGDGMQLPFHSVFDVVITRLADYSVREVCRVLKRRGYFFEYGLGPDANKEIVEFFPDTIDEEAFFFPETRRWKKEVCFPVTDYFLVNSVEDYHEKEYYQNTEEIMDLIDMVPLVQDFDREKDRNTVEELAEKYRGEKGIEMTWHYYILEAQRL